MLSQEAEHTRIAQQIAAGRAEFLKSYDVAKSFSQFLGAPSFAIHSASSGFTYGYRRSGDDSIIETLASHYSKLRRPIRCLEIGAGVSAQFSEISGHQGAPWLSRYLALHHSDKFQIVASDIGRSKCSDHLNMTMIHWPEGADSWEVEAESYTLWKKDVSPGLYKKLVETFSSKTGCGVAIPASKFGLSIEDFRPVKGASFPRIRENIYRENFLVLPQISPGLEKGLFNLEFQEAIDISSPPESLGKFDLIYGRHLGIGKRTLLESIPKLAERLTPKGRIFMYTDYSPYTVQITYDNGKLEHTFPDESNW